MDAQHDFICARSSLPRYCICRLQRGLGSKPTGPAPLSDHVSMKATLSVTQCRKMYRLQSSTSEAPHRNLRVRVNKGKRHLERAHGLLQKVAHICSQGIVGPMIHQCLQHVHAPIAWTLAGWWIRFRTQRQERRISRISETPQRWEARHTEPLRKQHCQQQSRTRTVAGISLACVALARSRVISCCRFESFRVLRGLQRRSGKCVCRQVVQAENQPMQQCHLQWPRFLQRPSPGDHHATA